MEQMKCRITRLFFKRPDFSAGTFEITEGDNAGHVGNFAGNVYAEVDDDVILEGEWVKDPKWGDQFKVSGFQYDAAPTRSGLVQFLAKDKRFKGIGPARAEKIVEGIEALGDSFEGVLMEVPIDQIAIQCGITPDLVTTMKDEWFKRADMNRVMVELAAFEVSPGQAQKLYEEFGPGVVGIVQRDPYWLIGKVRGFGFKTVDEIALKAGISRTHQSRLTEGIKWIMSEGARSGHTHMTLEGLTHDAIELLQLDDMSDLDVFRKCGNNLVATGELIMMEADGARLVWLAPMHRTEVNVAKCLITNGRERQHVLWADKSAKEWSLEDVQVEFPDLVERQAEAVMQAANWRLSVITGGAGVGKTYTVDAICRLFEMNGVDSIALCAPTGKAAKRMEESMSRSASTIHMLLRPKFSNNEKGETRFDFEHHAGNPIPADLIVVDEVSMVDVRLFRQFFDAIDWHRTVVVLVGDHNQLPPVGPGAVLRDVVNKRDICPVTVLDQVHRQAGELKENVCHVLDGRIMPGAQKNEATGDPLAPWYVINNQPAPTSVAALIDYMVAGRLSQYTREVHGPDGPTMRPIDPIWDVQVLSPMRKGDIGVTAINRMIQRIHQARYSVEVPPPLKATERPKILVHDKVINVRNNYKLGVMNGAMGRVVAAEKDGLPLTDPLRTPDSITVDFEGVGEKVMKGEDMYDLELAYAMTVHKSQGSEYPVVLFVCHKAHSIMHHRGLFYTAVSRARQAAIIVGDSWGIKSCAEKQQTDRRRTMMGLPKEDLERALNTTNVEA